MPRFVAVVLVCARVCARVCVVIMCACTGAASAQRIRLRRFRAAVKAHDVVCVRMIKWCRYAEKIVDERVLTFDRAPRTFFNRETWCV
jgi:hypothetical protein